MVTFTGVGCGASRSWLTGVSIVDTCGAPSFHIGDSVRGLKGPGRDARTDGRRVTRGRANAARKGAGCPPRSGLWLLLVGVGLFRVGQAGDAAPARWLSVPTVWS